MPDLYLTLVHYPIYNKRREIVTTAVTNFDLHDLSRTAKTYGVKKVFILTPSESQRKMVGFIWDYWHEGFGASYNPDRKEAFEILSPAANLQEIRLTIEKSNGSTPYLVATTAKDWPEALSFQALGEILIQIGRPVLIAFGTGHGLTDGFLEECDAVLEPIQGAGGYNHLPVRAAVAIVLDRLLKSKSVL